MTDAAELMGTAPAVVVETSELPRRFDLIVVTDRGRTPQQPHQMAPLLAVRAYAPAVLGEGDQMCELMRHRVPDEINAMLVQEGRIESDAPLLQTGLAGAAPAQIEAQPGHGVPAAQPRVELPKAALQLLQGQPLRQFRQAGMLSVQHADDPSPLCGCATAGLLRFMMPSRRPLAQPLLLLLTASSSLWAGNATSQQYQLAGHALEEASGLATAGSGGYWSHNDSGHAATLFHVDPEQGRAVPVSLPVPALRDWEEIAGMRWRGRSLLILADVGDNRGRRDQVRLHFIEEPAALDASVRSVHSLALRFPDGPRDCEAVAFDPLDERIYLLSKRDQPPRLYSLDAAEALTQPLLLARFEREVEVLSAAGDWRARGLRPLTYAPTAMDIRADGGGLLVLNYLEAYWWPRTAGQSIPQLMAQPPHLLERPGLPQAEGISFTADGTAAMVISEQLPTRLVRLSLPLGPTPPIADNPAPEGKTDR